MQPKLEICGRGLKIWKALSLLALALCTSLNAQTVDSFNPGASANSSILALASQSDGKILIGGTFTNINGQPRTNIARLNEDGSLDLSFNPGANDIVNALAIQVDGKILVGGSFTNLGGQSRNRIGRLFNNGTLDTSFNPGASATVLGLGIQTDGKILVGGVFSTLAGQIRNYAGRLKADGSLDTGFNATITVGFGSFAHVRSFGFQPDGKILIYGRFDRLDGILHKNVGRLSETGLADSSFSANTDSSFSPYDPSVWALGLQPDGKIIISGHFDSINGVSRYYLGRLNSDGSLDSNFAAPFSAGTGGQVTSIAIQADGKILLGGTFNTVGGQTRTNLARLNDDGTLDAAFNTGVNATVYGVGLQPDGKIVITGFFTSVGGQNRTNIGRLTNTDAAAQSLSFNGNTVIWNLNGTHPETSLATFEICTNGSDWIITNGNRILNSWQITGSAYPSNATIRARGFTSGGYFNSSCWLFENSSGAPGIITQPLSRTNNWGSTASLTVVALGDVPLSYRWLKAGEPLIDGGRISGSTNNVVVLSNVSGADGGEYSVEIANDSGIITSLVATVTIVDPLITTNPAPLIVSLGQNATFNVSAVGTTLTYQWRQDGTNLVGATTSSLSLTNIQRANAGSYDVLVSNVFSTAISSNALLTVNVITPDAFNPGANSDVYALAVQPDQKILAGGGFRTLAGQSRIRIGRLNSDGTIDAGFNPGATGIVFSTSMQMNGRILAGGQFSLLGGQSRTNIGRINQDGATDLLFNPIAASGGVFSVIEQPDGKLVVGGDFSRLGGRPCTNIGRLNLDGTLDTGFTASADTIVYLLALQSDGKIVAGGAFTALCGTARKFIGRLNSDGSLDSGFNPGTDSTPVALMIQPDGKILVGGGITNLAGQARNRLGRLNADGTLDLVFNPDANGVVRALALQADGKILVGGEFTTMGGQSRVRLARLYSNGTLDPLFNIAANNTVYALAIQPDGRILVGGNFGSLGSQTRTNIGRLNNTDPTSDTLTFDGNLLRWMRSGPGPEFWRTSVEISTNGSSWFSLGGAQRITNGWELQNLDFPTNASIRMRGYVASGRYNSCGWFVEKTLGPPVFEPITIELQPLGRTNNPGTTAKFNVQATGAAPLSYQWCRSETNLSNSGNIAGVFTSTLTLTNVFGSDAGPYTVVVSNIAGVVTSSIARLDVNDPFIITQPAGGSYHAGQTVNVTVNAKGTALTYQWRKEGAEISGATNSSLAVTNIQWIDRGMYDVVVGGGFGSVTSSVAVLTVNAAAADAFNPSPSSTAYALAQQPDGKILVGSDFTSLGGQPRSFIGRLNPDGSLDSVFNPQPNGYILAILAQQDGGMVIGGNFTRLGGQNRTNIGRAFNDGTLDAAFNSTTDSKVLCLASQLDGKILVGGSFTQLNGQPHSRLGRLNPDGTIDSAFDPAADSDVNCIAMQRDGKFLVGGAFTNLVGQRRNFLGRLQSDGSLDMAFDPVVYSPVQCLAVQPDGKILVGGAFPSLVGDSDDYLARLNPDGTRDTAFTPRTAFTVFSVALQTDGKIVVGGTLKVPTSPVSYYTFFGRVNSDGSVDDSFKPVPYGGVNSLALQADGKVLVGGDFTSIGGQSRNHLARLLATEPAEATLEVAESAIVWSRSGTSPEIWAAIFEVSSDGTNWTSVGFGRRESGCWKSPDVVIPVSSTIRARGFTTGGFANGSSWFIESKLKIAEPSRPIILLNDSSFGFTSNQFGFNVSGSSGQVIVLEGSTNLLDWFPLNTNTLDSGPLYLSDPDSANLPWRFYRLRSQ
jgi:uncharacterized delta-60 repeat protein